MEIKGNPIFKLKKLLIPEQWKVLKNGFVDLEPDNNYPIDQVFYHFDEDILNVSYKDWSIDLGFYGGYLENERSGFFKIVVFKGDFNDGYFYEFFISRSTDEITDKLSLYLNAIPNDQLDNIQGITYDDNYDHDSFHIYSAIHNIDYRLSEIELKEFSRPKISN